MANEILIYEKNNMLLRERENEQTEEEKGGRFQTVLSSYVKTKSENVHFLCKQKSKHILNLINQQSICYISIVLCVCVYDIGIEFFILF